MGGESGDRERIVENCVDGSVKEGTSKKLEIGVRPLKRHIIDLRGWAVVKA